MNATLKIIEDAKQEAKEKFAEIVDVYFANHIDAIDNRKLTIDMVEDFLGVAQKESKKVLKEAAENAVIAAEKMMVEKKKCVPVADVE